ncbi:unnamed protein product [Adineta ricciae]|uniref:Uncharacterized protein n=1 Tax=Adineta ricciae TaxID=249248 RepID=A0A813Q3R2_ADIRI|nr:unnamed protein product [Adineta ricciae]CAF0919423.1 unnamed protein product [Adineta ricciae]
MSKLENSREECQPTIRQRVDDRHWQLFEARLKNQSAGINKENYTHPNDYRIIDRLKKVDEPQAPVEPTRRWESFCDQVRTKSRETNRVMSIFHSVWLKNWNNGDGELKRRHMTEPILNETAFVEHISTNDNDRKVISSILHRAS